MRYKVMVLVNGKWEEAKRTSRLSCAKGIENQMKMGGYKTKVVRLKDGE